MEIKENHELNFTAAIAIAYLLLFGMGEWIYTRWKVKAEYTRKIVHILGGAIALICPVVISDHRLILLLCVLFVLILIVSKKLKYFSSIHAIDRTSAGSYLFPVALYCCFYIYSIRDNYLYFYLPVIVLAVSDPLAAFTGKKYPLGKYSFFDQSKTISGSAAFFVSAFISGCLLIAFLTTSTVLSSVSVAALVALICAFTEGISTKGFDNITIPFAALAVLSFFH